SLRLRPYRAAMTIADRYHAAVEALVGRALPKGRLQYFPAGDEVPRARAALEAAGLGFSRPIVGISPGAMHETKRWPAERFGAIARRAAAAGAQVALFGSPSEAALAASVGVGVN